MWQRYDNVFMFAGQVDRKHQDAIYQKFVIRRKINILI